MKSLGTLLRNYEPYKCEHQVSTFVKINAVKQDKTPDNQVLDIQIMLDEAEKIIKKNLTWAGTDYTSHIDTHEPWQQQTNHEVEHIIYAIAQIQDIAKSLGVDLNSQQKRHK